MKTCSKCSQEKESIQFYRCSGSRDGLQRACKKCLDKAREESRKKNIEHTRAKMRERKARYAAKHPERERERRRIGLRRWKDENAEHVAAYGRRYLRDRKERDPGFKLRVTLSSRIWSALKGRRRAASTVALLGCSVEEAKRHIERQFQRGMTWANWGDVWHVDHIRPLSGFDLTDAEQLAQACHFTNLRPLWAGENMSKGGKQVFLI